MGVTKNKQSENNIKRMALRAFPERKVESFKELTEGLFNAAYLINFKDGSSSILKISAENNEGVLTNEVNLMEAEVKAMDIVYNNTDIKVARVQYSDTSKEVCNGNYFFMEKLEGESLFSIKDSISEDEKKVIYYEIGEIERILTSIKGKRFGLLSNEENSFDNLFDFVYNLISNVLNDGEKKSVDIGAKPIEILEKLRDDKEIFNEVKEPVLVHWDMWEGNIFIKDKHVSGIIDWERAMWGEAFMDDRFRQHTRNSDFLRGFGKEEFTENEMRRIYWYDIFLYLTMMIEVSYREYEDDWQYKWVRPLFEDAWNKIK